MYDLTEVMRQKDDKDFAFLLNRLREGIQTDADIETLQNRVTKESQNIENTLHLYTTRCEVDNFNKETFRKANCSSKVSIKAIYWVVGSNEDSIESMVLSCIPKDSSKTMGLSYELRLVINFEVEITNNVNVKDGVTNGSSCTVKKFDYRVPNSERVSIVWVEFEDRDTGKELRADYSHLYRHGIDKHWTPIIEVTRLFTIKMNNIFQVKRKQFPLQLASAKTIHKAQGSTLNKAVVHCGLRKNDHIHYVGLSRVTHIDNLSILHLNSQKISISPAVVEEMDRLRFGAMIKLTLENFQTYPLSVTKSLFFNIRSLHRHYQDLQEDHNLLLSSIICLSETRLKYTDQPGDYSLNGYTLHRYDSPQKEICDRPAHGLALYVQNSLFVRDIVKITEGNMQFFALDVPCTHSWVTLLFIYFPPKETLKKVVQALQNVVAEIRRAHPLIIAGDTNFDADISRKFKDSMLAVFGLKYLTTSVTTDYNSTLDHIYTDLKMDEIHSWGTLESYYSDHKPLFVAIK